jgi:hypothetical protein
MTKVKYEEDYYLWTKEMVEVLKNKDYSSVDWDNLIEEIEDMGKSQKRAVESLLMRLTEHLLKLKYWDAERVSKLFDLPEQIELSLTQVLDEDWFPNSTNK